MDTIPRKTRRNYHIFVILFAGFSCEEKRNMYSGDGEIHRDVENIDILNLVVVRNFLNTYDSLRRMYTRSIY